MKFKPNLNLDVRGKPFKAIVLSVLSGILVFLAMWLGNVALRHPFAYSGMALLAYVAPFALIIFLMHKSRGFRDLSFGLDGPKALWFHGWYLVVAGVALAVVSYLMMDVDQIADPSRELVGWYAGCILAGAVLEELLCRYFIQNNIKDAFEKDKARPYLVVILSSMLFAFLHLFNLIDRPWFVVGTMTQILYSFCGGMLLGALYYRTRRLSSVILLHFVFNFLASTPDLVVMTPPVAAPGAILPADVGALPTINVEGERQDMNLVFAIIQIGIMLPALVIADRSLRRTAAQERGVTTPRVEPRPEVAARNDKDEIAAAKKDEPAKNKDENAR